MTSQQRRRRWESRGPFGSFDSRIPLWIVGVGLGCFLLGYLVMAVLFFPARGSDRIVAVPELKEMQVDDARRVLQRIGLEPEILDSLPNREVAEGAVIAQTPLAGSEVQPGSPVQLIISLGRERFPLADVAGMPLPGAMRVIEALDMAVQVDSVPAPEAAGRVIAMEPAAGTSLPVGSVVRLTVSSGPPLGYVPDLVGLLEDDARAALDELGFRVGEVDHEFRPGQPGTVVRQHPQPGDSLRIGAPVTLTIGTDQWRLPGSELPGQGIDPGAQGTGGGLDSRPNSGLAPEPDLRREDR